MTREKRQKWKDKSERIKVVGQEWKDKRYRTDEIEQEI